MLKKCSFKRIPIKNVRKAYRGYKKCKHLRSNGRLLLSNKIKNPINHDKRFSAFIVKLHTVTVWNCYTSDSHALIAPSCLIQQPEVCVSQTYDFDKLHPTSTSECNHTRIYIHSTLNITEPSGNSIQYYRVGFDKNHS